MTYNLKCPQVPPFSFCCGLSRLEWMWVQGSKGRCVPALWRLAAACLTHWFWSHSGRSTTMRWVLLSKSKLVRSDLHQFRKQVTISSSAAVSLVVMQYLLEQPPVVDLNCLERSIINMLCSHYINLSLLGGYAEEGAIFSDGTAQKSNGSHDRVHGCLCLPPSEAHGPNWYANYRPFYWDIFSSMNAELCVIVISKIIKRTFPMTRRARACRKIDVVDQECSFQS